MSRLTQRGSYGPLSLFQTISDTSSVPQSGQTEVTYCGARFDSNDGREFILVQNANTALTAGTLVQSPALVSNHQGLSVTAYNGPASEPSSAPFNPPPSTTNLATVTVTLGATAATVNQYAGGYVLVATDSASKAQGQLVQIASHPAADASGSLKLTLQNYPVVALSTTCTVNLLPNPFLQVIASPTTLTNQILGFVVSAIPASTSTSGSTNGVQQYGFVQSQGVIAGLSDSTAPGIGVAISPSTATAGAFGKATLSGSNLTSPIIGYTVQAATSTDYSAVYVNL